ncbi:NAD(P)H-flavin reductase [Catenovulum sp. SM1970]|uniref:NAD(P)H-flavin reductase n=1 Tax=Marinifaba aquimaris TaxID=2741323 RepID=UPI0015718A65|nr:NAD(P)H-flavin reductase [Marinifaba aquimaris]NTS77295.1 NAD(P)H-flavin reductase [Marinifaba aquimaris]
MQATRCSVKSITNLTEFVFKVKLGLEQALSFKAGQYLLLVIDEKDKRAFSIANAPSSNTELELHIGAGEADSYAMGAIKHFQTALENGENVIIEAPGGNAHLREDSPRPVLLAAGGTGFTYTKSIADQLLEQGCQRPLFLYWGVREEAALYEVEHWQAMAEKYDNFSFVPVVDNASAQWQGKSGNLIDAVLADFDSLADYDIYCAGRFEMVGKAREAFLEKGLVLENMYGDAFAFIK